MTLQIAIQDPKYLSMCRLPDGSAMTKAEASQLGYVIARNAEHAAQIQRGSNDALANGDRSYLDEVMGLPEARERPAAAARLASAYSAKSMPLPKAALFLSGLPSELAETAAAPVRIVRTPAGEARLKARVEAMMPELHKRAVQGDKTAQRTFTNAKYALRMNAASATPFSSCLRQCEINPDVLV